MSDPSQEQIEEQRVISDDMAVAPPPHDETTGENEETTETSDQTTAPVEEDVEIVPAADGLMVEETIETEETEVSQEKEPDDFVDPETIEHVDTETDTDENDVTVESVIEAVLFASDEPVTVAKLGCVVEQTGKQIRNAIKALNTRYKKGGHAFRIETIAGGFQMFTLPTYESWLRKLVKVRGDSKLSPAALETLAVVAYKQPVIRADIEAIRGVASGEILRTLMSKNLVKIVGRAEVVGRPMQYGTTKRFLEIFGLNSIKDLPTIEELKKPEDKPVDPEPQAAEPTPEPRRKSPVPEPIEHPPAEFELEFTEQDDHHDEVSDIPEPEPEVKEP